jgi:GT2 family glycosyltransferase
MICADDREIRAWISAYKDRCARRYTFDRLVGENFVSQMTVFWRRRLLDEVGVLDPELKLAFDYDLWLRLAKRSAPLYIGERQASLRWYETTKSGSSFIEQFREDYEVARRNAPDRRHALFVKRLKSLRIVTAYRLMRVARKLGRG